MVASELELKAMHNGNIEIDAIGHLRMLQGFMLES